MEIKALLEKEVVSAEDLKQIEAYEPNDGQNRLYSFFTPVWLCDVMYKLAIKHGFNPKGRVLEPSCGHGNFLTVLDNPKNCVAFELDPINYKLSKLRSPEVTIYNQYFETAFLQEPRFTTMLKGKISWLGEFDLVIGNPPYGKYKNLYSSHFKSLKFKQTELFFMYQSMRLLKPNGLLVFITASSFMRSGNAYTSEKKKIGELATFVDAYRMPKVFKNTDVPTDILIFRRK